MPDLSGSQSCRYTGFELLRCVACIGIIWFHLKLCGSSVGYGGLPALMVMSTMFAVNGRDERVSATVIRRSRRLLLPWVFWNIVYGGAKVVDAIWSRTRIVDEFDSSMLLSGTAIHLWYLPCAFCATLGADACGRFWGGKENVGVVIALWICSALMLFLYVSPLRRELAVPLEQWLFVAPAAFLGVSWAFGLRADDERTMRSLMLAIPYGALCLILYARSQSALPLAYMVALLLLLPATLNRRPAGRVTRVLGSLSFGVYLLHPLVASVVARITSLSGAPLAVVVVTTTFACVWCLRRGGMRAVM